MKVLQFIRDLADESRANAIDNRAPNIRRLAEKLIGFIDPILGRQ